MSALLRRIIGLLLILTAIGGLVFSIYALSGMWRLKPTMTETLIDGVTLVSDTMEATSTGLVVLDETLRGALSSMQALQDALATVAETIGAMQRDRHRPDLDCAAERF